MIIQWKWQIAEKAMASHFSTLAWKILWTEEPGGLQSMGRTESDTTEGLHFHFSLSRIGEGNGNPLQCSCLENPRDGGAWSMGPHRVGHDWSDLAAVAATVTNRVKRLDLIECLKNYGQRFITLYRRWWPKSSPRNARRQSVCLLLLLSHFSRVRLCATP